MIQLQVHLQLPCYDFCFLYWRNVGELSSRDRISACPITCIAPSSETTTGGVYKWQGRNRHSLMSCAYEAFLVARPIIAILGPNWVDVIPVFPRPCGQAGPTKRRSSCSHWHCSARVAQSIEEHHRPAVAQNLTLRRSKESCREGTTKEVSCRRPKPAQVCCHLVLQFRFLLGSLDLVRWRNQPNKSLHRPKAAMHHHWENRERTINLSILTLSGSGKVPRVESN